MQARAPAVQSTSLRDLLGEQMAQSISSNSNTRPACLLKKFLKPHLGKSARRALN